jgi:hypothetical protein
MLKLLAILVTFQGLTVIVWGMLEWNSPNYLVTPSEEASHGDRFWAAIPYLLAGLFFFIAAFWLVRGLPATLASRLALSLALLVVIGATLVGIVYELNVFKDRSWPSDMTVIFIAEIAGATTVILGSFAVLVRTARGKEELAIPPSPPMK